MGKTISINMRIQAENADAVKKALEGLGVTGGAAMKKLEAAAKAARPEAKALAAAADDLKGRFDGLGNEIPGVTAALRGLGPVGTVVAGAFGLITAAVAAGMVAAREYMTWAADLTDAADAVQTNVESLQAWRFAMEEVGGTSQALDTGLAGLNSTIGALKTGLGDVRQVAALKELGLDPNVVRSWNNLEEALPAIIKGFENVGDEASRVRLAERLNIKDLLPLLRLGSDEFRNLEKTASDLGYTVDQETVKALDQANRRLELVSDRIRSEAAPAAVFFADVMADIGEAAANSLGPVMELVSALNSARREQREFKAEQARNAAYNPGAADGMGMQALAAAGVPTFGAYESGRQAPRRMTKGGRGGGGGNSGLIDSVLAENARRNGVSPPPPDFKSTRTKTSAANARAASNAVSKAADAVRQRNQRELDRATLDELQATQAMAKSSAERRDIAVRIATTEKSQSLKAIEADKDLDETAKKQKLIAVETAYQAELAKIASEAWDELGQQLEEQKRKDENSRRLIEDAELSKLESSLAIAATREESLDIELKILDLVVARQLAEIDALKASEEAKDLAKAAVAAAKGAQAKIIERQNQGPLGQYRDRIKKEGENINDALESIAVGGLQSLEDGLMSVIDGTKSVKDAFSDMARSILAELTRLAIRQWIIKPILDAIGGNRSGGGWFGGGRAMGGPVMPGASYVVGERGPERFTPMMPGMITPSGSGGVKVTIYNAPTPARVQERPDGGVDIIFQRLDAQDQRINQIDRSIEGRALGAYGDAARRGYL